MAESTRQVLALAERLPGLVVLPAHDPAAAGRLLAS
jgi:N-acyl homoserine lactone hydrolase